MTELENPSRTCLVWSRGIHHIRSRKPIHVKERKHHARPKSLKEALLLAATKHAAPHFYVDASDVSFTASDPFTWAVTNPDQDREPELRPNQTITRFLQTLLAECLANYTTSIDSQSANDPIQLDLTLSEADAKILRHYGYDETELQNWMTILITHNSFHAAHLVTSASENAPKMPPFVYLYLLRRQHIGPRALRLLLQHMPEWHRSLSVFREGNRDLMVSDNTASTADQSAAVRAFVRLLRHARRVWPEAIETLTAQFIALSHLSPLEELGLSPYARACYLSRLTAVLNRALYLLAEPAAVEPFKSALYQEAAQTLILRHMADHEPPLIITREGYRGVARVQLAKPKTHDEMDWARLKSPSWPPWKEDRTGMDADIGLDHGISRARQVLNRMQEAGYQMKDWERAALIYAGWDTDQSPTIQTRALMPAPSNASNHFHAWAGRIRSTRSVHQAWAGFLAYEDEATPPHQDVYLAMFEKLAEEAKRLRLSEARLEPLFDHDDNDGYDSIYPGDVKETFPPPASSHQSIYTRTEPPSVSQFHQHMIQHGLLPTGRLLAFLVDSATTMQEALAYLESSRKKYPSQMSAMIHFRTVGRGLDAIPDSVFTAYVRLLCRFPHTPLERPKAGPNKYDFGAWDLDLRQPLARAIYLLVGERRQNRPAWNALLEGFARRKAPTIFSNWKRLHMHDNDDEFSAVLNPQREALDKLIAFNFSRKILSLMDGIDLNLDTVGFRYFCIVTEHAARASRTVLDEYDSKAAAGESNNNALEGQAGRLLARARNMTQEAPYIRSQFWTLVSAENHDSLPHPSADIEGPSLPRLLTTPSPAILHQYIRAVGFLRDYKGLRELVQWMVKYWPELSERKAQDRNSETMMRRVIVSLRVFLEGSWEIPRELEDSGDQNGSGIDDIHGAPRELLNEVSELVDGVEEWGGWAEDDEVLFYLDRM